MDLNSLVVIFRCNFDQKNSVFLPILLPLQKINILVPKTKKNLEFDVGRIGPWRIKPTKVKFLKKINFRNQNFYYL